MEYYILPRDDSSDTNYWQYIPNFGGAVFFAVVFGLITIATVFQSIWYRAGYMWVLAMGTAWMVIGFTFRAEGHFDATNYAYYLLALLFIVLAPIFFLAANYVIFGRLLRSTINLDTTCQGQRLSFLPPRWISLILIGSDILSFLIQASGSSLTSSDDDSVVKIGMDILMGGMAMNLASFALFVSCIIYFDWATRKAYLNGPRRFHALIRTLYISWAFIMVRLIFRTVEFATGWNGPVYTNEKYFYCFDATMMVFATVVYIVWWPTRYGVLSNKRLKKEIEAREILGTQQGYELSRKPIDI